jgi:hypothetical protein
MNKQREARRLPLVQVSLVALAAMLCCGAPLSAKEGSKAHAKKVPAIFESEKSWEFDHNELVFHSENPNADDVRFLRWKGYNWVVTAEKIMVIDPRPYGTRMQAPRHRQIKGRKIQSDKDMMNELKKNAKQARKAREPKSRRRSVSVGLGVGVGRRGSGSVGLSFGF